MVWSFSEKETVVASSFGTVHNNEVARFSHGIPGLAGLVCSIVFLHRDPPHPVPPLRVQGCSDNPEDAVDHRLVPTDVLVLILNENEPTSFQERGTQHCLGTADAGPALCA